MLYAQVQELRKAEIDELKKLRDQIVAMTEEVARQIDVRNDFTVQKREGDKVHSKQEQEHARNVYKMNIVCQKNAHLKYENEGFASLANDVKKIETFLIEGPK